MKKQTILFLMMLLLVACGGAAEESPAAVEATRVDEAAVDPTPTLTGEVAAPPTPAPPPPEVIIEGEAAPEGVLVDSTVLRPWPADRFGYGIQVHGNATVGNPAETMQAVHDQLGLNWVKMQMQWWLIHPEPGVGQWFFYDGVVDEAAANDLNLMISVVGAPAWSRAAGNEIGPPDNYQEYANFLTELINRYPGKIGAIEVWNEQNLDREWQTANGISPEDYVQFLQVAYNAIKAADSNIVVISGALSPTGPGDWVRWADDFAYMDRALAAGMLNYADCVGAHHNGYNVPPDVRVEDTNNLPEAASANFRGPFDNQYSGDQVNHLWTFKTTMDGYVERVRAYSPDMKVCVTEFGWASSEGYAAVPEGFEFALDNTLQEQAEYIVQAYQQMHAAGDYWLVFLFNFDFGNKGSGELDDPVPYSILDINGIPRPAFAAVVQMEKPD
jgi:hypothetical protein